MAELLGTTSGCVRVMLKGTLPELRRKAKAYKCNGDSLKHWAIYRAYVQGRPFHNATDERFLIEHHNDPYWLNRGYKCAN